MDFQIHILPLYSLMWFKDGFENPYDMDLRLGIGSGIPDNGQYPVSAPFLAVFQYPLSGGSNRIIKDRNKRPVFKQNPFIQLDLFFLDDDFFEKQVLLRIIYPQVHLLLTIRNYPLSATKPGPYPVSGILVTDTIPRFVGGFGKKAKESQGFVGDDDSTLFHSF